MKRIAASDIVELPIRERIRLVEDIWDSIAEVPESLEVPDWHRKELDRRLKLHHENPNAGYPWSEVRQRILSER